MELIRVVQAQERPSRSGEIPVRVAGGEPKELSEGAEAGPYGKPRDGSRRSPVMMPVG